jgi:hypothetical protein
MASPPLRLVAGEPPPSLQELAATPDGSFFHTPVWMRAVAVAAPHLQPCTLLLEDSGSGVRAAWPFLGIRQCGIWRAYAGAWGTYGGIVGRDAAAREEMRLGLDRWAASGRIALVRIHDFSGSLRGTIGWQRSAETCQVLDLPADPQALFEDSFTTQNRNKIRKAEKLGLVVRRARDREALSHYAALYDESAQRWKLAKPLPGAFFLSLADAPGVDVWLAERDAVPVAALLNFTCGGQVMNWGNVSRRDAWGASPNNLLHWRALEAACVDAAGPRLYNFGGSGGLSGVETFKSAFGTREHRYLRWEHRAVWVQWLERARRGTPHGE